LKSRGFKKMADTSRMSREAHVRICGGLEVRFLRSTRRRISFFSSFCWKYAGYDSIVIEGKADRPVWLSVVDNQVEIDKCMGQPACR
jgi:hypothetical protein